MITPGSLNQIDFGKEQQQLAHVFEKMGFKGVVGYLFGFLSHYFSVTRLTFAEIRYDEEVLLGLGELSLHEDFTGYRSSRFSEIPEFLTAENGPDEYRQIKVNNRLTLEDDMLDPAYARHRNHRSCCWIPISTFGQSVVHLVIFADEYDMFSDEFAREMQTLLTPLGYRIRAKLQEEQMTLSESGAGAAYDLLQHCRDMKDAVAQMEKAARYGATVLLTGETGTGKTVAARIIHELSDRKSRPFVSVNCGALPESLADSLLFGHERGAFTGALKSSKGFFEQANGGTIFLDEIGDLPSALQLKLLKAVEEKTVQRIGGTAPIRVEARVIAATNQNLWSKAARGEFREDLLYRLSTYEIYLPALRERQDDFGLLLVRMTSQCCEELGIKTVPHIPWEEKAILSKYAWPGNIRELKNVIKSCLVDRHADDADFLLLGEYLQKKLKVRGSGVRAPMRDLKATASGTDGNGGIFGEITEMARMNIEELLLRKGSGTSSPVTGRTALDDILKRYIEEILLARSERSGSGQVAGSGGNALDAMIKNHIADVLVRCHGKISGKGGAAEILDIPRSTLYLYMKKYGLNG